MTFDANDLSRSEALVWTRQRIGELADRAAEGGAHYARTMADAWEQRLREAAEESPAYLIAGGAAAAIADLMGYVESLSPEEALDWIDLLPRNVMELAEPAAIIVPQDEVRTTEEPVWHEALSEGLWPDLATSSSPSCPGALAA